MVLCEELLSGKFCILMAGTLARSQSNARTELCTVAADGCFPGLQLTALHGPRSPGHLGCRFFSLEIPSVVQALPGSLASSRSPVIPRSLPYRKTRLIV